jgi:drug/metabolite transporter (DMT)-like permease
MSESGASTADTAALLRGRILVLVAGAGMSLGGLFIRSIEAADEWQILFWRSIGLAAALLLLIAFRSKGKLAAAFRGAGRAALLAGLCLAAGFTCFIFSMTHTTVANTLFLLSAGPFIAAILARLLLGEAVRQATWIAMGAAALGVAVMVGDGVAAGDPFGDLTALGAATGFAGYAVALRGGRGADMMPATCLAGLIGVLIAGLAIAAGSSGFAVTAPDLALCLVYGALAIGGSLAIYTVGSRHVPAAELMLLALTEVVLGPIWVWLAFSERPSLPTLGGGAILLLAITGQALSGMRRRPPPIGVV